MQYTQYTMKYTQYTMKYTIYTLVSHVQYGPEDIKYGFLLSLIILIITNILLSFIKQRTAIQQNGFAFIRAFFSLRQVKVSRMVCFHSVVCVLYQQWKQFLKSGYLHGRGSYCLSQESCFTEILQNLALQTHFAILLGQLTCSRARATSLSNFITLCVCVCDV